MTENEAKKVLERDLQIQIENGALLDGIEALTVAIKVLEEVQQYRQIGTVEECREAVEKQTDEKPTAVLGSFGGTEYECKNCGNNVCYGDEYCRWCGQKLDWSDGE